MNSQELADLTKEPLDGICGSMFILSMERNY